MILRGGRLTHADMAGLDEFKASLKRGIDVMLLGKKIGFLFSHLFLKTSIGTRTPKVLWMDSNEKRIITAT